MVVKSFPWKQVPTKIFHQIFLWLHNFLKNRFPPKIFIQHCLVENFLWSQNHFLQNRFLPKIFISNFCSKFFIVAKSFPRKQVPTKNFHRKFSSRKIFLWLQNYFLENSFLPKIFICNFVVENFLWLQNHFLENTFLPKISIKTFGPKFFMVAK